MSIKWFTGGFFGDILLPTVPSRLGGEELASEIVHERIFTTGSTHFVNLQKHFNTVEKILLGGENG